MRSHFSAWRFGATYLLSGLPSMMTPSSSSSWTWLSVPSDAVYRRRSVGRVLNAHPPNLAPRLSLVLKLRPEELRVVVDALHPRTGRPEADGHARSLTACGRGAGISRRLISRNEGALLGVRHV